MSLSHLFSAMDEIAAVKSAEYLSILKPSFVSRLNSRQSSPKGCDRPSHPFRSSSMIDLPCVESLTAAPHDAVSNENTPL